jgi:hypothetical protein
VGEVAALNDLGIAIACVAEPELLQRRVSIDERKVNLRGAYAELGIRCRTLIASSLLTLEWPVSPK